MTRTTYQTMDVSELGPDATEADLAEFRAICAEAERLHPEIENITDAVFGDGDYFRNARRLGVDVDAIVTRAATTISRTDLENAVREQLHEMYAGGNNEHYVRVWPDGVITRGEEVSKCLPESEYFGRDPHPVTIWLGRGESVGPDAGLYYWIEDADGAYVGDFGSGRYWSADDDRAPADAVRFSLDRTDPTDSFGEAVDAAVEGAIRTLADAGIEVE